MAKHEAGAFLGAQLPSLQNKHIESKAIDVALAFIRTARAGGSSSVAIDVLERILETGDLPTETPTHTAASDYRQSNFAMRERLGRL